MGAASSSQEGEAAPNPVQVLNVKTDYEPVIKPAPVKRKRHQDRRHQKRHRKDAHPHKRKTNRHRTHEKKEPRSSEAKTENRSKKPALPPPRENKPPEKKEPKNMRYMDSFEAGVFEAIHLSKKMQSEERRKQKDSIDKKVVEVKSSEKISFTPALYDLTNHDMTKIYDLRAFYSTIAAKSRDNSMVLSPTIEAKNPNLTADDGKNSEVPFFSVKNDDISDIPKRANKAENISDKRSSTASFSRKQSKQFGSLRNKSTKRSSLPRISLRFPGKRSKSPVKPAQDEKRLKQNVSNSLPKKSTTRVQSCADSSFLESDVSFHMQGAPRKSHVVLASASTVPIVNEEDQQKPVSTDRKNGMDAPKTQTLRPKRRVESSPNITDKENVKTGPENRPSATMPRLSKLANNRNRSDSLSGKMETVTEDSVLYMNEDVWEQKEAVAEHSKTPPKITPRTNKSTIYNDPPTRYAKV